MNDTKWFLTSGHSNWTICSQLNWFCSEIFPHFYPSYWEVQFLITPERGRKEAAGAENGEKGFLQKWIRHRGFCTWGIQVGPFAACRADFVLKIFHLSTFHTGRSNSLLPQREEGRKEGAGAENGKNGLTQKWMRHSGLSATFQIIFEMRCHAE